jgi:putative sugar O-methyltransferase
MLRYLKKSARHLLQLRRSLPPYVHWTRKLSQDPLFKMAAVDRGLLPRPTSTSRTEAQRTQAARRIIDAYRKASADQRQQRPVYQVSNEWIPIFRRPLRPLLAALEEGNAEELRKLLDNFFRNSISAGLIGLATDMEGAFFKRRPSRYLRTQLLIDSIYRYRLLQELLPNTQPRDLHIENFGNPYGVYVGEEFLRAGVDYQYYYAQRVAQLLPGARATVVELGGGIGGFAYFLNKARPRDLTYVNLDLPEILCISSYQLLNLLPDKRTLLYGESELINSQTIASYDLALLPSFLIESLDADSVDVSFNSYSLAEMDQPSIQNYVQHLSRISRGAILHVNHVADSLVSADNFAFDREKFELKSRTRALWNLGRNLTCDEYEFLLVRVPS